MVAGKFEQYLEKSYHFKCRLPFDEAQLEIPDEDKTNPFPQQPQGFINNNPPKNNPIISGRNKGGNGGKRNGGRTGGRNGSRTTGGGSGSRRNGQQNKGSRNNARNTSQRRPASGKASGARGGGGGYGKGAKGRNFNSNRGGTCPGGNIDACVDACVPIQKLNGYRACVSQCGKRC